MTAVLPPLSSTIGAITVPASYTDESGTTRKITLDENGIPRDQWKRPVVRKADGSWAGFSRISAICKELDKGEGLKHWSNAMTVIGVAIDPVIRRRAEEIAAFSDDPYGEHSTELIRLAEAAQEVAGSTVKRELGTTLHDWAQILDRTGDMDLIPAEHRADITAYRDRLVTGGVQILESEVFVVVDEIEIAGSLDKLVLVQSGGGDQGRIRIGDVKTGQHEPRYPMNVEMQVAGYARGARYNLTTHQRSAIHPDLDTEQGVLIWMPSGTGSCELFRLNLRRGWQNLMLAKDLKRARKESGRRLHPISIPPSQEPEKSAA